MAVGYCRRILLRARLPLALRVTPAPKSVENKPVIDGLF